MRGSCFHLHRARWKRARALVALVVALALAQPASGASYYRDERCTGPCRPDDHLCVAGGNCTEAWDACPPGTLLTSNHTAVDELDCHQTGCTPGGCDAGWSETSKEVCFDASTCLKHAGVCFRETCCRIRPQMTCCELLPCKAEYDDCEVPTQRSLNDSSRSDISRTRIAHTGSAAFPFYSARHATPERSCEAARLWGHCTCSDGASLPGCNAFNSSTWAEGEDAATAGRLPAGLFLTCAPLPGTPPPFATEASPGSEANPSSSEEAGQGPSPADPSGSSNTTTHGGGQGGKRQGTSHHNGGVVAGIVIACIAAGAACVAAVSWCCGAVPDWRALRIRGMSYEPVFTGQSYTPGLGAPGQAPDDIPWARFCAAVGRLVNRLRGRPEGGASPEAAERYRQLMAIGKAPSFGGNRSAGVGGRSARASSGSGGGPVGGRQGSLGLSRGSSEPDGEDGEVDEVFTLEDLGPAGPVGSGRGGFASAFRRGSNTPGRAVEMGVVGGAGANGARGGQFGAPGGGALAGAGLRGGPEVVHTRPMALSDGSDEDGDLDAPILLSPQVTGQQGEGRRR
ncbi:hypothetical protein HYH03_010527 [Edaphochlamys debaryana]|uniref:Uncharacterized protein n=1 Tax=Edaphochlamys debaryana TaxID=47281 RepID=A0A836BWK7_9CHLO|nr:hypothetical protein HYH03_010527 [Edaphochlamys debaryana]|eukprot:KAG2491082.1 hypothetical protein HYH03_010527 [Edaphochlamys debaryana]